MNALRSVSRVGSRRFSTAGVALLVLFGCLGDSNAVATGEVVQAEYPSVGFGALAMAAIPYDRWVRFILPFMLKIWIVGSIALAVAVWIGYA